MKVLLVLCFFDLKLIIVVLLFVKIWWIIGINILGFEIWIKLVFLMNFLVELLFLVKCIKIFLVILDEIVLLVIKLIILIKFLGVRLIFLIDFDLLLRNCVIFFCN